MIIGFATVKNSLAFSIPPLSKHYLSRSVVGRQFLTMTVIDKEIITKKHLKLPLTSCGYLRIQFVSDCLKILKQIF